MRDARRAPRARTRRSVRGTTRRLCRVSIVRRLRGMWRRAPWSCRRASTVWAAAISTPAASARRTARSSAPLMSGLRLRWRSSTSEISSGSAAMQRGRSHTTSVLPRCRPCRRIRTACTTTLGWVRHAPSASLWPQRCVPCCCTSPTVSRARCRTSRASVHASASHPACGNLSTARVPLSTYCGSRHPMRPCIGA